MTVWIGTPRAGDLRPDAEARIDAADAGFTHGLGLFETMRVERGRVFLLPWHLERMRLGAARLGIDLPEDALLQDVVRAVIEANDPSRVDPLRGASPVSHVQRLRLTVSPGTGETVLLCTIAELEPATPDARLLTSPWRRNERSALAGVKSTSYAELLLAQREAVRGGATDALLWNTVGEVAECATANVFVFLEDGIRTPPPTAGILPGIGRRFVLALGEASAPVREAVVRPQDLARADGAFCVSALRGIRPIVEVDHAPIAVSSAVSSLMARYHDATAAAWCWT